MTRYLTSRIGKHNEQPKPSRAATASKRWRVLQTADRACCCSARPSVIAVIPPKGGREHPATLLFCRHHYRESGSQLAIVGALCFDAYGDLI